DPVTLMQLRDMPVQCNGARLTPGGKLLLWTWKTASLCDPQTGKTLSTGIVDGKPTSAGSVSADGRVCALDHELVDLEKLQRVKPPRGAGIVMHVHPQLTHYVKPQNGFALFRAGSKEGWPIGPTFNAAVFTKDALLARTGDSVCAWSLENGALLRSRELGGGP